MLRAQLQPLCTNTRERCSNMSDEYEKTPQTEEEKKNNSFSFIVGIVIVIVIMIAFVLLFNR